MKTPVPNSWISLLIPPERFQPLEVQLRDLTTRRAIWTGAKWWSGDHEVVPQAWRPVQEQAAAIVA